MTHNQIFRKTMPFVWLKLLLGLITVAVSAGLFALSVGLMWLLDGIGWPFLFAFWMIATVGVHFVIVRYVGYLVRAGHVAVVAEAVVTGSIPDNQVIYGKDMVKERFAAANAFFALSKLIDRSVKQIQRSFDRVGGFFFGAIPGAKLVMSFVKLFIAISLKYIDECCLGWVFHNKNQGSFKSALDGVVIYAQNWKALLKSALKTSVMVIFVTIVLTVLLFFLVYWLMRLIGTTGFGDSFWWLAAFFLALFSAIAFKRAFIDSYMMVRMVTTYMQVAPETEVTVDLYEKFSLVSSGFRELFMRAEEEGAFRTPLSTEPEAEAVSRFHEYFKRPEAEELDQSPPPTTEPPMETAEPVPVAMPSIERLAVPMPTPVAPPVTIPAVPTSPVMQPLPLAEPMQRVVVPTPPITPVPVAVQKPAVVSAKPKPRVVPKPTAVSVKPKTRAAVRPKAEQPAQVISCRCGHMSRGGTRICGKCGQKLD